MKIATCCVFKPRPGSRGWGKDTRQLWEGCGGILTFMYVRFRKLSELNAVEGCVSARFQFK